MRLVTAVHLDSPENAALSTVVEGMRVCARLVCYISLRLITVTAAVSCTEGDLTTVVVGRYDDGSHSVDSARKPDRLNDSIVSNTAPCPQWWRGCACLGL